MNIRPYQSDDLQDICDIYNHYIENTIITFEEEKVSKETMEGRILNCLENYPWMVCAIENKVCGYAYASRWKERSAYRHSVEVTVYLDHKQGGKGYGKAIYSELLDQLGEDVHAVFAGIALPNEASIGLHESFGFEKAAHFKEVGQKFGRWVDVGYWQKILTPTTLS